MVKHGLGVGYSIRFSGLAMPSRTQALFTTLNTEKHQLRSVVALELQALGSGSSQARGKRLDQ